MASNSVRWLRPSRARQHSWSLKQMLQDMTLFQLHWVSLCRSQYCQALNASRPLERVWRVFYATESKETCPYIVFIVTRPQDHWMWNADNPRIQPWSWTAALWGSVTKSLVCSVLSAAACCLSTKSTMFAISWKHNSLLREATLFHEKADPHDGKWSHSACVKHNACLADMCQILIQNFSRTPNLKL